MVLKLSIDNVSTENGEPRVGYIFSQHTHHIHIESIITTARSQTSASQPVDVVAGKLVLETRSPRSELARGFSANAQKSVGDGGGVFFDLECELYLRVVVCGFGLYSFYFVCTK